MNVSEMNKKAGIRMILLYLVVQLLSGIIPAFFPEGTGPGVYLAVPMIMFTLGAAGMIILERRYRMVHTFEEPFSPNARDIILWGIVGVFVALFVQNIAGIIEATFLGSNLSSVNTTQIMEIVVRYPAFLLLAGIAGPIMEEFVFRKVMFGLLLDKIGGVGAAVISSLFFAFVHLDGLLLVYSSMGFVFSWLYYKTKNIWTPIIAHCMMNVLAVLLNLFVM
ncbi:CPBP family intramembrane glutamic endopeptidase [Alkalibacterium sp. MB6]|uniref:CPBP family intramembrane glutamic endopeptidase n=1 Tax=Alkalibacterium sp. MB6 TaxID=2081965 RepID=UPI0013795E69|nr:type II CAAX endopeptidase family protein [Alkalibacterium sp. MB6]